MKFLPCDSNRWFNFFPVNVTRGNFFLCAHFFLPETQSLRFIIWQKDFLISFLKHKAQRAEIQLDMVGAEARLNFWLIHVFSNPESLE